MFPKPKEMREWLVFKEDGGLDWVGQPRWRYLLLTHVDGSNSYHWSGRVQYCTLDANWIPVKSYGYFSQGSEFEDDILSTFRREYRMPIAVPPLTLIDKSAPEGWVAPDGKFYPVDYGGHSDTADEICELILHVDDDCYTQGYKYLHEIGWVSLHQGYILNDGKDLEGMTYTKEMLITLTLILYSAENEKYIQHMQDTLKKVEDHVA